MPFALHAPRVPVQAADASQDSRSMLDVIFALRNLVYVTLARHPRTQDTFLCKHVCKPFRCHSLKASTKGQRLKGTWTGPQHLLQVCANRSENAKWTILKFKKTKTTNPTIKPENSESHSFFQSRKYKKWCQVAPGYRSPWPKRVP